MNKKDKIAGLLEKGVTIPDPDHVLIGEEVSLDRVSGTRVVIYPGCKVLGEETLIMDGVTLGYEAPVTIENCQLGPDVALKGGFFKKATFLDKASMGAGAHVREGCLLEEEASGAHTVGLKQAILFPYVTLGSLINFCDCLMAGGTSRKNHSEVGSSYIHFNYSANQDKVTASLVGDVPKGVMLDQAPIFLGGQGGLVGPIRIGYGAVIAAGVICRKDVRDNMLVVHQNSRAVGQGSMPVSGYPKMYTHIKRRVMHNVHYVANLLALKQWYIQVRSRFSKRAPLAEVLHASALDKISMAVTERIKRLEAMAKKMPASADIYRKAVKEETGEILLRQKEEFFGKWEDMKAVFEQCGDEQGNPSVREPFLQQIDKQIEKKGLDYLGVIQGLEPSWAAQGTDWLEGIVKAVNDAVLAVVPSFS